MKRWWLTGFAIFLLSGFVFLPQIASTSIGKPFFGRAVGSKIGGQVEIRSLSLSWFGPQAFNDIRFQTPDAEGNVEKLQLEVPFWKLSRPKAFLIQDGSVRFPSLDSTAQIIQINGEIRGTELHLTGSTREGNSIGRIAIDGKVVSPKDFEVTAACQNLPTAALDRVLNAKGLLFAAAGASINVNGQAKFQETAGTVDAVAASPNLQTAIRANLTTDALTLREPFELSLMITPALGRALLLESSGDFAISLESKAPVVLRLEAADFSLPFPFLFDRLQVGRGSIDLRQIRVGSGKKLFSVLNILDTPNAKNVTAWFSPLRFSIRNGELEIIRRCDFLINRATQLCLWGKANLGSQTLDLYAGLSAKTLESAFGIQNIPDAYVMKIPIRGTFQKPKVDTSGAKAKIATILAGTVGQQIIPNKGIGKLLNPIAGQMTKIRVDPSVPAPERPFPWE